MSAAVLDRPRVAAAAARAWIREKREELRKRYFRRRDAQRTLGAQAAFVDELLQRLWRDNIDDKSLALVAVGGYGRGALFPHSDVDVLVLMPDGRQPDASIEKFIGALWDSGLEPGHSVRTVAESIEEAAKDVTVDTSLLESRLIAANATLVADLQLGVWLAGAAGFGTSWRELAEGGFITPQEAAAIAINERVLQDLRIRLHHLAGRREDRLVFDHQIEIARSLKLEGPAGMAPSDLLMRRYYLAAKAIWRFNQILLSNLFARITPEEERKVRKLHDDFVVHNLTLELRDEKLFEKRPGMMLEAFRRLQDNRG